MADLEKLRANLEARGYAASFFQTAAQAADYLDARLDGAVIGFGGSVTVRDMGLYERLSTHNTTFWHWKGDTPADAGSAGVYISSVNAVAETGELINIDGNGNRVSATIYGPGRVYLIAGINKIAPDFDAALWRARNIAAPKNAQRLRLNTPCAAKGDRCYHCTAPDRICRVLTVFWERPRGIGEMELVIINEELGF
ncbi:MAG: lactate utilization protein [Oscillospiraceae bacterium]